MVNMSHRKQTAKQVIKMSIIKAAKKFQRIAIFEYCEINEAWFHTRTMSGEDFEAQYGENGCDALALDIQWRVI